MGCGRSRAPRASPLERRRVLAAVVVLSLAGIALRARTLANLARDDMRGADFPIFYASGLLVGTPELYSAAAVRAIELREMGVTQPPALFVRLPYFAALMAPWARLPFWPSFWIWRMAILAAACVFIWLWPAPREWSLLALAWSLPFAFGLTNGQDSAFLLLWVALALALWKRGHEFAAGLVLSLCAAKFHLFLLLPLLLPGRRKMAWGGLLGGALLIAACFAVQGPHWFAQFLGAIGDPSINPDPSMFFNLRGLARGNTIFEILLAIPVVAAAVYVTRRAELVTGLAMVLAAGLLIGHQQTVSDTVLLIPVALTLAVDPRLRYAKVLAVFLVTPVAYFLMMTPGVWQIPRLLLLALVFVLAWEVRTGSLSARTAAGPPGSCA